MTLKEYLDNRFDSPMSLAFRCELTIASIYNYLSGKRKPYQWAAERIEKETGGRVTVEELRGKDERRRSRI